MRTSVLVVCSLFALASLAQAGTGPVELVPPDLDPVGRFGERAVAIEGQLAAVGEHERNGRTGAVHVFERGGDGAWTHLQRIDGPDVLTSFGISVALQDGALFVGASDEDGPGGADSGVVRAYTRAGAGTTFSETDAISGRVAGDRLGNPLHVSSSGGTVILAGPVAGSLIRVLSFDGADLALEQSIGPTVDGATLLGGIDLAEDRLVLGADDPAITGQDSETVLILERDGGPFGFVERVDPPAGGPFGSQVALGQGLLAVLGDAEVHLFSHDFAGWHPRSVVAARPGESLLPPAVSGLLAAVAGDDDHSIAVLDLGGAGVVTGASTAPGADPEIHRDEVPLGPVIATDVLYRPDEDDFDGFDDESPLALLELAGDRAIAAWSGRVFVYEELTGAGMLLRPEMQLVLEDVKLNSVADATKKGAPDPGVSLEATLHTGHQDLDLGGPLTLGANDVLISLPGGLTTENGKKYPFEGTLPEPDDDVTYEGKLKTNTDGQSHIAVEIEIDGRIERVGEGPLNAHGDNAETLNAMMTVDGVPVVGAALVDEKGKFKVYKSPGHLGIPFFHIEKLKATYKDPEDSKDKLTLKLGFTTGDLLGRPGGEGDVSKDAEHAPAEPPDVSISFGGAVISASGDAFELKGEKWKLTKKPKGVKKLIVDYFKERITLELDKQELDATDDGLVDEWVFVRLGGTSVLIPFRGFRENGKLKYR